MKRREAQNPHRPRAPATQQPQSFLLFHLDPNHAGFGSSPPRVADQADHRRCANADAKAASGFPLTVHPKPKQGSTADIVTRQPPLRSEQVERQSRSTLIAEHKSGGAQAQGALRRRAGDQQLVHRGLKTIRTGPRRATRSPSGLGGPIWPCTCGHRPPTTFRTPGL